MRALLAVFAFAVVVTPCAAAAQQMPDPSQMAGRPLPAPELPTGSVSVRLVRERMGNNITNHPVTLKADAAGRTLTANTDEQGRAQFADIPVGALITLEAIVDGETLRSQRFPVPANGGVRVALIAGLEAAAARERAEAEAAAKAPARRGVVVFGGETRIILEFQQDNLQVFYLLDVVNGARTPIDVGEPLVIELPDEAAGAGAMDGSSPLAVVQGDRIRITGPFPPGTTQVQVGYRLRYSGDATTIVQRWPAAIEQLFVAVEKIGDLRLASPQLSEQQEARAGGSPFVMATGPRLNAGDALTLNLSGLPHRNTIMRDLGLSIGVLVLALGFWAAWKSGTRRDTDAAELQRRRERLFVALEALEQQRRQHQIDQPRYASRRQALIAKLERVMAELDHAGDGDRLAHKPRDGGPDRGGDEGVAA